MSSTEPLPPKAETTLSDNAAVTGVNTSEIPTHVIDSDKAREGNFVVNGLAEIGRGMATVFKHFNRSPVTLEYPEVMPTLSDRFHGRLTLLTKSDGTDLCVGCKACARVCPCDDLIQIEMHRDENKKPIIDQFTIDMGRCIFCGNCTEVCPVDCIKMLPDFELSDYSRQALVLDKKDLTLSGEESDEWRQIHGMEAQVS